MFHRTSVAPCLIPLALALTLGVTPACGGDEPAEKSSGPALTAPSQGGSRRSAEEIDGDVVEEYLDVVSELRAKGMEMAEEGGDDPRSFMNASKGWAWNDEWRDILDDHDFDEVLFTQVHTRMAMAFGAVMMEKQLETVPEAQRGMMEQMMGSGPFAGVSDEDKALARDMFGRFREAYGVDE